MGLLDVVAKLSLDSSEYDKGLREAGNLASGGFSRLAKAGAAAMTAATTAVTGFAAASVKTGMTFDKSMSQVAATMGLTMSEMESEIGTVDLAWGKFSGNLREYAQEMGRNTAFSASQAADALNYMALAGYDAQTSMSMLPNVLNLAAAGNFDLARASDMVTDTQTAFGISLERTSQLVDEMAKAASTGNTSVEQLGDAFLVIGGLAQELNGGMIKLADGTQKPVDGIQELEIALTAMANAGIKGSEAGTHMRNMLLKLSSPASDGAAQMEALGVSIFDTEGNMRSLSDIMGDLNGSLETLTQEQKIQAISDLFNTRDLASAEALLNAVGEDWDKIGASILDAKGAAQQMADTQLDNLAGDVTLFKSALEGAQIAISDGLAPSLRKFVKFGTDAISRVTDVLGKEGLMGAASLAGDMLGDFAGMVIDALPSMVKAGAKLLEGLAKGIVQKIPDLAKSAVSMVVEFGNYIKKNASKIVESGVEIVRSLASGIGEAIPILKPLSSVVDVLASNMDLVTAALKGAAAGFVAFKAAVAIGPALDLATSGTTGLLSIVKSIPHPAALAAAGVVGIAAAFTELTKKETALDVFRAGFDKYKDDLESIAKHNEEWKASEEQRMEAVQRAAQSMDNEALNVYSLRDELDRLIDANGRVKESDKERADQIAGELMDALGYEYDKNGDLILQYQNMRGEIDQLIQKRRAQAILDANQDAYIEAMENEQSALRDVYMAEQNLEDRRKEAQPLYAELAAAQAELAEAQRTLGSDADATGTSFLRQQERVYDAQLAIEAAEAEIGEFQKKLDEARETHTGYSNTIANQDKLLAATVSGDADEMTAAMNAVTKSRITAENSDVASLRRRVAEEARNFEIARRAYERHKDEQSKILMEQAANDLIYITTEYGKLPKEARASVEPLGNEIVNEITEAGGMATDQSREEVKKVVSAMQEESTGAESVGESLGDGLTSGIKSSMERAKAAAREKLKEILNEMKITQKSASPSKITRQYGQWMGEGYALGINDTEHDVMRAAGDVVDTASGTFASGEMNPRLESPATGDYDEMANAFLVALNRFGLTVEMDRRELGRVVRRVTV